MKLSVSIPDEDVDFLDEYAAKRGYASRSAVVQRALQSLRNEQLGDAYQAAFREWEVSEDAALWESTTGDGLRDAPR